MPAKKKKPKAAAKRPLKTLTRKAIIGWLVAVFIACGWMFALGVLVGRDQAPIEFDIDAIEKKLSNLQQRESAGDGGGATGDKGASKDKNELGFYEALEENRQDTELPKTPKPKVPLKNQSMAVIVDKPSKPSAAAKGSEKKSRSTDKTDRPSSTKVAAAPANTYTIQASSVKNKPDADRLVSKLKKKGFPVYLLTSKVKGKGTWHRVRIGSYASKVDAAPVLDRLRKSGMKPILVKRK